MDSGEVANSDARAIIPVRAQTVDFYGDAIPAAQAADEIIYVPLRPIVEALGLSWAGQRQRLRRDPLLDEALCSVVIHTVQGERPMLALPLDLLPGWLFGISSVRVKPELQEKITRYRRECFRVLWNAFKGDIQPTAPPPPPDLNPAEQALLLAEAVASLARQHLELEGRYTTMADFTRGYIQQSRRQLAEHDARLSALELRLGSGATISEAQAAEIAGAVKAVAMLLTAAGDANGFGRVWGELYRRYQITSYHNLPAARYDEARTWLQGWFTELSRE